MERSALDPVTLEVIRNRVDAIAQEMQDALVRSAFSNVIKEGHDCSAALFDRAGEMIAQATALPVQLGVLPPAVQRVLAEYPPDSISDGDVFILNDPYHGGTHLPDIILVTAILHEARTVAFAACIAHHQDVGGKTPGSIPTDATDIFQEGLRIPLVKFYEAGQRSRTVHAFIERNVRIPRIVMGDLGAQLAALHVGKTRLRSLFDEHGTESLVMYMAELLDRAEQLTQRAIGRIRPGTYTFEDFLDDDGIVMGKLVRIRATITVSDSELRIDFTGSEPQVRGPINADCSAVLSTVYYVVKAITDPTAPNNAGCYRPIRVELPEGLVVNPRPPAPVNGRTITVKRISDALLGALVQAMPGRIPAAPSGLGRILVFGGVDPLNGQQFVCNDFSTGGTGGRPERDGVDSLVTDISNTMNMPAESLELNYPLRVHRNALCMDSGGAGRWRGGLGVDREIEILRGEVTMTLREDRHCVPAWGLYGGSPAALARAEILRKDGENATIPSKGIFVLKAGDRIRCWGAGGAGYGDPLDRDPERVLQDVTDRKVSSQSAREEYGVMFDEGKQSIDRQATIGERDQLRLKRGAIRWIYDRGEMGRL